MTFRHVSVLLQETIEGLNIRPDGIYADGTLGGGGHASEVAARLTEGGRLIGIDQDADAIAAATERLKPFGDRVTIVRDNYVNMKHVLADLGIEAVDGICLDLGVSSYQLDTAERGDLVNDCTEQELFRIIRDYGEDRFAKNIAKHIVKARERKAIRTTGELADIIRGAIPMKIQVTGGHPAMRTFQALRIALNGELQVLEDSIDEMIGLLKPGGRICIITFHSLEDRIVKNGFRRNESPCTCPPGFPVCVCGKKSRGTVITKKPILPTEEETEENPRSRSAKLRIFERA